MKCENCSSKHDGSYGSGRFCCQKCARGFSTKAQREEINIKVSKKLTIDTTTWRYEAKSNRASSCMYCGGKLTKYSYYFCSINCQHNYKYLMYINKWKLGIVDGRKGKNGVSAYIKKYLKEKYGNKCMKCGWNKINIVTKRCPINLHHIDGNALNNKEENLELLCPNCHSLTENFGNLNNGCSTRIFN